MNDLRKAAEEAKDAIYARMKGSLAILPNDLADLEMKAYFNLRAALEAEHDEPVAWMNPKSGRLTRHKELPEKHFWRNVIPLYTHPPAPKPLTDDHGLYCECQSCDPLV